MKTVIFDLDGTLADTSADLIGAANASFRRLGHGDLLDPVADRLVAFHGAKAMLRMGFSRLEGAFGEAEVDREYPLLVAYYGENLDRETRLYPGAVAAVERLLGAGYALGVCTNKPEGLADVLLERLGVRGLFASLIGADTLAVRKPDPAAFREAVVRAGGDPGRAMLVGDTVTDVECARAADVPVVLVGFGPEGPGVARLGPDAVIGHYDHLDAEVARLIG